MKLVSGFILASDWDEKVSCGWFGVERDEKGSFVRSGVEKDGTENFEHSEVGKDGTGSSECSVVVKDGTENSGLRADWDGKGMLLVAERERTGGAGDSSILEHELGLTKSIQYR